MGNSPLKMRAVVPSPPLVLHKKLAIRPIRRTPPWQPPLVSLLLKTKGIFATNRPDGAGRIFVILSSSYMTLNSRVVWINTIRVVFLGNLVYINRFAPQPPLPQKFGSKSLDPRRQFWEFDSVFCKHSYHFWVCKSSKQVACGALVWCNECWQSIEIT